MKSEEIAEKSVRLAAKLGATQTSVLATTHRGKTVEVFNQHVQSASDEETTRLVIRVFKDDRGAVVNGQCSSEEVIEALVKQAMSQITATSPDKLLGLPSAKEMGKVDRDLGIFDRRLAEITQAGLEEIALGADSVIRNALGGGEITTICKVEASNDALAVCTSEGFKESYPTARLTLTARSIGDDPSFGRSPSSNAVLGPPMSNKIVAGLARTVRTLEDLDYASMSRRLARDAASTSGARPSPSGWFPVVFTSYAAQILARIILHPLTGRIAALTPFEEGKIGDAYCSAAVTMVDDGTETRGFRTAPFDEEGVKTHSTVLIERGIMTSYLLNSYYGRVLEHPSTGNASASVDPRFSVIPTNAYVEPGGVSPDSMVASIRQGFYVTGFLSGVEVMDTNFTQAASGFWIENGKLGYPVRAAAVSCPRLEMLKNIVAVGDDPERLGPVTTPSLLVSKMSISPMV
jgi:PmbA protein